MPLNLGSNEIDVVHNGSKEIQEIYAGTKEIWTNTIAYYLGNSTSFNIKNMFPKINYRELTANNFFIMSTSAYDYDIDVEYEGRVSTSFSPYKSYNPSTGVLSCGVNTEHEGTFGCAVYFVPKPDKLIYLGSSTSIDIKNRFPKWRELTANNFCTLGLPGASARGDYDAHISFAKSYSNGVIGMNVGWSNRPQQQSGYYGMGIYLIKKL